VIFLQKARTHHLSHLSSAATQCSERQLHPFDDRSRLLFENPALQLATWKQLATNTMMRYIVRQSLRSRITSLRRSYATTSYTDQHIAATAPTPYWKNLEPWKDVKTQEFLSYGWQVGKQINAYLYVANNTRKPTPSNDQRSS
jgi:hypothetical protein